MAIATPPLDLNQYVDHVPILQSLEIPVKDHLPTTVRCPFCGSSTLGIHIIPVVGGRWYYCSTCEFKGDSIELYHTAHKLPDIRDAVFELVTKQILPLSRDQVRLEIVNEYVTTYIHKRKRFEELFAVSQHNLKSIDHKALALLHELHLWGGYRAGHWHRHVSKYMGVVHAKEAREYGIDVPLAAAFSRLIVMPFYDIPGHICSLLFRGSGDAHLRVHSLPIEEDGLMMLDTLPIHNEDVIAVRDPIFALQLQRRQFNRTQNPLPVIVYGSKTKRAWHAVSARRVIYWDQSVEYDVYRQALDHPRAYIANHPQFENSATYLDKVALPKILEQFSESAKPWAQAMKQLILTGEHWKICDFVLNMNMSTMDLQRIYELCSPAELQCVKRALGEVAFDRYVHVAGMRISEGDDNWWITNKDQRELACSAIIRLDSAIHAPDTGDNYYEGVVINQGKQLRFCEKMDVIEKHTSVWLRDLMMRNGMAPPTVQQCVKPHLLAISKQFQEPAYVQRSGKVGWNPEVQGFVFPNFTVRYGTIDDSNRALVYDTEVPGANLTAGNLADGDWDVMMEETPESAAIWAGLACFMTNMIAPVVSSLPTAVGFIGGSGSVARAAGQHLVKELDMIVLKTKRPRLSIVEIVEQEQLHGYPVWLDITMSSRPMLTRLSASDGGNFMLDLLEGEATSLSVGDRWTLVNAPMVANQQQRWPKLSGIVRYLAWLQAHKFTLQPATSLHASVLYSLCEWAVDDIGVTSQGVFRMAEAMLIPPGRFTMEQRLLHLIFWLQMSGDMKMEESAFYNEFKTGTMSPSQRIIVDPDAKKVYVSMRGLRAGVVSARLPAPDFDEAVKSAMTADPMVGFEMGTECFVLNYPYWAAELKKWLAMRTQSRHS